MGSNSIVSILLLDTNIASKGIYDYLYSEGHKVYVIGNKTNDYLAKISPNYIEADYCNIQSIKEIITNFNFDYIIPGCNDKSYSTASILSNLKNNKTIIENPKIDSIINNKSLFKKFCFNNNIPTPKRYTQNSLSEKNSNSDIIVKPADGYSGKGITKISKKNLVSDSLRIAVEEAIKYSSSSNYIIEEFIEGQLYSHSCFIDSNQEIIKEFIVEEHCIENKYAVDHSFVVKNPKKELLQIKKYIKHISSALGLGQGLIHTQFILSKKDNIPYIIEITRRCPGDMYYKLIEDSTGFNYSEMYANGFIKSSDYSAFSKDLKKDEYTIIRKTLKVKSDSRFNLLHISKINNNAEIEILPYFSSGKTNYGIEPLRIALVFIKLKSQRALFNTLKTLIKSNGITIR